MSGYRYSGARTQSLLTTTSAADINAMFDDIVDVAEKAARPAAQAGAQVLYEGALRNVANFGKVTGNLAASIYQAYSRDNSPQGQAEYHVSWRTGRNYLTDSAGNKVKLNVAAAPHGHLIEFGFVQRYVAYIDKKGQWHTAVRPEMRGKPKPKSRAPQAVKDAYYVLRNTPLVHPPRPFIRPLSALFPDAAEAMRARYLQELEKAGVVK